MELEKTKLKILRQDVVLCRFPLYIAQKQKFPLVCYERLFYNMRGVIRWAVTFCILI